MYYCPVPSMVGGESSTMNKPESTVVSAVVSGAIPPESGASITAAIQSATMSKYQNGLSNLGIALGFAKADDAGNFALHQNACAEMALQFRIAEGARPIEFDYEPVTVLYHLMPQENAEPERVAIHVCRMARSAVPKVFLWNSKRWAVNLDMYPFGERYDQLSERIQSQLAEEHEWPAWVQDAIQEDEELEAMLNRPTRRGLHSRLLITGRVSFGDVPGARKLDDPRQHRILLRQDPTLPAIAVQISNGTKGMQAVLAMAEVNDPIPVTFLLKPLTTCVLAEEPEKVASVNFDFDVLESFMITKADIDPSVSPPSSL